jgi:hypothetical protein
LIVTVSALLAVTVSVEESPAAIDVGLAAIVTVGFDSGCTPELDPHPAAIRIRNTARPGASQVLHHGRIKPTALTCNARSTSKAAGFMQN